MSIINISASRAFFIHQALGNNYAKEKHYRTANLCRNLTTFLSSVCLQQKRGSLVLYFSVIGMELSFLPWQSCESLSIVFPTHIIVNSMVLFPWYNVSVDFLASL